MAQFTFCTKEDIDDIAKYFGIINVNEFKILSGGSENTNYLLKSEKGKYVLTLCEQKTEEDAKILSHLLEYLEKCHFETSKIIRTTKNKPLLIWQEKPVMLKTFIEGTILEPIPLSLLELAGSQLGKLHKIKAPEYLPKTINYGKEQFVNVKKYAADSLFDNWLDGVLEKVSPYFKQNLPKSLIHSDVFSDNIIVQENSTVIIMDFEEAAYYYRIFDIGMMIIGTCAEGKKINLEKVKSIMTGYNKEVQLLNNELNALQTFTVFAGAAMTFWRHINFNYMNPDDSLKNHYMELKTLTDFAAEQQAEHFLEAVRPSS